MADYKQEYQNRKERIIKLLGDAKGYFASVDNEKQVGQFDEMINQAESGEFSIAIIGEFSSGKSTFLNALMHERILPSWTNETTATINFLRHVSKAPAGVRGQIFYEDGHVQDLKTLELHEVEKYVGAKNKEVDVAEKIHHVDLYLDSKYLENGVTLVDTPGLNGVADHHTERTEDQANKSHACIFMFTAEQPGRGTDFAELKKLKEKFGNVLIVLNKIDRVNPQEQSLEEVIDTLKANYKKQFPDETGIPEIHELSAYQSLVARSKTPMEYAEHMVETNEERLKLEEKSKLEPFENRLMKFLTQSERAKQEMLAPITRIQSLLGDERKYLEEAVATLEGKQDKQELENQIADLDDAIQQLEGDKGGVITKINSKLKSINSMIKDTVDADFETQIERLSTQLSDWTDLNEIDDLQENITHKLKRTIKTMSQKLTDEYSARLLELLQNEYVELLGVVDVDGESDVFNINVATSFEFNEGDYDAGLANYEENVAKLNADLKDLRGKANVAELSVVDAIENEQKIKHRERELASVTERAELFKEQTMMTRPSVVHRNEQEDTTQSRGGIFGFLGNAFLGPKHVTITKVIEDRSELDEFNENVAKREQKYDETIENLTKKMEEMSKNSPSSRAAEMVAKQLAEAKKEKMEEIEAYRKKASDDFKAKNKIQLRKLKNELTEYLEDISGNVHGEVNKMLREKTEGTSKMLTDVLLGKIENEVTKNNNRLKQLKDQLESSENEKQKTIAEANEKLSVIRGILSEVIDMNVEVNNIDVDKIKEIDIKEVS